MVENLKRKISIGSTILGLSYCLLQKNKSLLYTMSVTVIFYTVGNILGDLSELVWYSKNKQIK